MKEPTDRLRNYGEDIASAVSPARSRVAAMRAIGSSHRTSAPRRTPQFAFAALGIFLVANVVMSGVANAAVPGDVLYPVDRGYEKVMGLVGLAGDQSEERVAEAGVLLDRGDLAGATALVAEATDSAFVVDAAASLQAADPSDPRFAESVQALVASARDLVAAREAGGATRMAEAEAALRLAAMQVSEAMPPDHAGTTAPPSHAGEQGPPEHARDDENPGRDDTPAADPPGQPEDPPRQPPEPPGPPAETPGQAEETPGQPEETPGQPEDPPGPPAEPPGPPQDPPGPPDLPEQSQQTPGESRGQGQPEAPEVQPGGGGGRADR